MRKNVLKSAAAAALAGGLMLGVGAPVQAQGLSSPGLNSPGLNSPGISLPKSEAKKVKLLEIGGPVWAADVYVQVIKGLEARPGDEVTVRVEVVGTKGEARLREIGHSIPADFKLVRVTRQSQDNLLGGGIYTLKPGEYTDTEKNGNRQVRLSWNEGGFLGLFKDNPTVSKTKSVSVDFTYKAPDYEGEFDHGAAATVGALINPSDFKLTGGEKIKVSKSSKPSWWPF